MSKPLLVSVASGKARALMLTQATEEDAWVVQFCADIRDDTFADVMRDGKPLTLTAENTPVILTIPGTYKIVAEAESGAAIVSYGDEFPIVLTKAVP